MKINISLIKVEPINKGKFVQFDVTYKDLKDGKVNNKKVADFSLETGKTLLSDGKDGDLLTVEMVKEDKYWNWKKVTKTTDADKQAPAASSGYAAPKSTYETSEERARRQDFIIRQSSLSSAISLLKTEKTTPTVEDVVKVAEEFVKFVYAKPEKDTSITGSINKIEDDIPY